MKKISITIYSILISIILIFSISYFGYNIYLEYNHGLERTKKTFNYITKCIKMDDKKVDFQKIINEKNEISGLSLTKNQKEVFSYPDSNVRNFQETKFTKLYKETFLKNQETYEICIALYVLRPSVIYKYARFSFLIILVTTLFTSFLIIYYNLSSKNTNENKKSQKQETFSFENEDKTIEENSKVSQIENSEIIKTNDNQNKNEVFEKVFNDEKNNEINKTEDNSEKENKKKTIEIDDEFTEENETKLETQSLYSPVTGFCWERKLQERLDNELVKSASNEQDLSLFLIQIEGLNYISECSKKICKLLLKEAQFRDLVFEYKDNGFAFIKPDITIEQAEVYADSLYKEINAIIENGEYKCSIGVSARNIRMLTSNRLILEADEALKHTKIENTPVIAFHVDVDKYRELLKNS